MIIAIDGPSGAGKSTLGKRLAQEFGLIYLDTGAMYRAVGLAVIQAAGEQADEKSIVQIADGCLIEFREADGRNRVYLNGEDVTEEIRSAEVSNMASLVSTIGAVREILVRRQQQIGTESPNGAVLDGRDIGTVVFPNADYKFYLTADAEHRARRRYQEDLEKGLETTFERTLKEILERDERDAGRLHSPLTKAEDAIEIDTSSLNVEEVFEKMASFMDV